MEHTTHPNDFIDNDEGWEIDPREPFYAEALPCESCGAPCNETHPASWDASVNVGPCCSINESIPDVPVCQELLKVIKRCPLTLSVSRAMEMHRECCEVCQVARIEPQRETTDRKERAA